MSAPRRAVGAVTLALLATLLSAVPARADAPVIARTGDLTARPAGMPVAAAVGARRLVSATVRQDLVAETVRGTFVLGGVPDAATGADLVVALGEYVDGVCQPDTQLSAPTSTPQGGFSRSGATITMDVPDEGWLEDRDCAFAALVQSGVTPSPEATYDLLGGTLVDVLASPELHIGGVGLLGKKVRTLRLVRGAWTVLSVTVRNSGRADAPHVRVTGRGKGLRVKGASADLGADGGRAALRVEVKLTGKRKKARLRLVARDGEVKTVRKIAVRKVARPRRPTPGTYRDGEISFRVTRNGRIAHFRGTRLRMRCQAPGDYATYRYVNLSFPTRRIGRNGIVDAVHRWSEGDAWYSSSLRLRITGSKVRRGRFSYTTAGWCGVDVGFRAHRR